MNKTILIAGGTAVVSLAIGGTAGYFVAKKQFDDELDERIAREVGAVEKHYSVLLMEARSGKPDSPADIPKHSDRDDVALTDAVSAHPELDETELAELEARADILRANAQYAQTNYQGISTKLVSDKPELSSLVESNIFTKDKQKKTLPPRDETGKFVPKHQRKTELSTPEEDQTDDPYLITAEEYLHNYTDYDQKTLRYFVKNDTLIDPENNDEAVDNDVIHPANLTQFPPEDEQGQRHIYVRNDGLKTDYEVQLMEEDLTDYMGLGEDASDVDESAYL